MRSEMQTPTLHLLLPFALPTAAEAPALLSSLPLPALERLLVRGTAGPRDIPGEPFQRTLPHERWLARAFGLPANRHGTALAPYMLLADGGTPGEGFWFCAQPVHIHIARDHLVLTDPADLDLPDAQADALREAILPLLAEASATLAAPNGTRWYLSADALNGLDTTSPLRACGHNIDIWMPDGDGRRVWLKLQNEIQMTWFAHPINEAREAEGRLPVNSIWLHGGGRIATAQPAHAIAVTSVLSTNPAALGLARHAGLTDAAPGEALPPQWQAPHGDRPLVELDDLAPHFVRQDWARWRDAWTHVDQAWLAPALAQLEQGALASITLVLCGDNHSASVTVRRADLHKFWRRGSLLARVAAVSQ